MIGTYVPVSLLVDMHMCLHVQTLPTPLLSCLSDGQIKPGSKLLSQKLVEELVHTIEGIRDNLDLGNQFNGFDGTVELRLSTSLLRQGGKGCEEARVSRPVVNL